MVSGSILKPNFTKVSFVKFWCSIKEEYTQLPAKALKILLLFSIIYLCEAEFSSYAPTKTTYLNRLNKEADGNLDAFYKARH